MSAIRVVESSGSLGTLQISDGSGNFLSGSLVAGTNITIGNNGSGQFTINSTGGGSGGSDKIGAPEDGSYEDGLFIDFDASTTTIGTAVDRFNEILKALAPSPAPNLDDINTSDSGIDARLAFGSSNNQSSSTPAYFSVDSSAGIGAAVDSGAEYSRTGDKRIGIFTTLRDVNGHLNEDVAYNSQGGGHQNFPANSFGNADQGNIFLEVNGSNIVSASLTDPAVGAGNAGSGTDDTNVNGNGSGFLNLSAATAGTFSNGNTFTTFKHRTGEYIIKPADQRLGWNYARVKHTIGGTTTNTNYIEWVNDTNNDNIEAAGNSITFTGSGSIHLSGVEYFQSGTVTYKTRINNAYKYIFRNTDTINFNTSPNGIGFNLSNKTKADFPFAGSDTQDKVLHLTASDDIAPTTHLNGSVSVNVSVSHPKGSKSLSNGGASSASGILIYDRASDSSITEENFVDEVYRIQSGSYDTQNDVTHNNYKWDSEVFITASNGGHSNGLQVYDGFLKSPTQTLNGGNFSSFANGPSGNPDYSGQNNSNNIRTYYRYFRNTTGTQYDLSIDIDGSGTIVAANSVLDNTKIHVFVKVPGSSIKWVDVGSPFVLGQTGNNDGVHIDNEHLNFVGNLSAGSPNTNYINFGNVGIANNEYLVLKIVAKETWTGNIDDITVDFGAGQGTVHAVPDLSTIGSDNTGVSAKLSFDDGKIIGSYVPVDTTAGGSDIDLNQSYSPSGNRRGIFAKNQTLTGHLNHTINADSPNVGHSYKDNSFSDANVGSLILKVNGNVKHQVEITGSQGLVGNGIPGESTVNGTSLNSNSSGFINLSNWVPGKFSTNGVPRYSEIFRIAKYQINPADQVDGFNYAQVIHDLGGGTTRTTNYIEWVNDSAGATDDIAFTNLEAKKFGDNEFFHLSGVKYFISPTGSFGVTVDELYTNVYSAANDAIEIDNHAGIIGSTATNIIQKGSGVNDTEKGSSGNTVALASLIDSADTEKQLLHVTASCAVSHTKSLRGSFVLGGDTDKSATLNFKFKHPLKNANGKATSNVSATNFLIYSSSDNSTHTHEYFRGEKFRIGSGSYSTEASVTSVSNAWNSTRSIDDASFVNHQNGLMVFDEKLISPLKGGQSGNFRNKHESSSAGPFEGPDNNVDYSSVTKNEREYFRYFINPTSADLSIINVTLVGDAELKSSNSSLGIYGALGANKNIYMDIKVPGQSEFMDCARQYAGGAGQTAGREGDGCRRGSLDSTVDGSGATNQLDFDAASVKGTASAGGPDPIIIRIRAHKDWTGYVSRIQVTWSS